MDKPRILPVGDSAILLEFGQTIDPVIQARVSALDKILALFPHRAITEWVPTYRSLMVHYDPWQIAYAELAAWLQNWLQQSVNQQGLTRRQVTIPVLYGGEIGPDLETVATHNNLTPEEVVKLHQEPNYLVYMLGFLPGFPYLGGLDQRLTTPRLATPRTHVPAGSVGIADRQTGIYPLTSPGGWQLIGRTPLKLYDPSRPQPFLLAAGDELRFQAITQAEFDAIAAEGNAAPTVGAGSYPARARQGLAPTDASHIYGLSVGAGSSVFAQAKRFRNSCESDIHRISRKHIYPARTSSRNSVHVVTPGLFTTVQDLGRAGFQRFGVPVAGVFDTLAAQVANWLVGNSSGAALLELTYSGPTLVTDTILRVAITGGQLEATLDGEPLPLWRSFLWQPGQELKLGSLVSGARAYLAVQGGWQVPMVMGSRSTYVRAAIGGLAGRQLKAGDQLPVAASDMNAPMRRLPCAFWPQSSSEVMLRFVPGPQTDYFAPEVIDQFCATCYSVSQAADRMGVRLQGPAIEPIEPDIISDAIALGSIQVPRDGQPIIMGPDRQTTGGYPKIGTVITPDMGLLAQAKPGDIVRFQAVTIAEAQQLAISQAARLQKLRQLVDNKIRGQELRVQVGANAYYSYVEEICEFS